MNADERQLLEYARKKLEEEYRRIHNMPMCPTRQTREAENNRLYTNVQKLLNMGPQAS